MTNWYELYAMLSKAGARFTVVDVDNPTIKARAGTAWIENNEISF